MNVIHHLDGDPRNNDPSNIVMMPAEAGATISADRKALDRLNLLLSAPEWPGASGMEDVCEIVRATGRIEVPNAPEWPSH
jgi:hypothetical protein